MAVIVASPIKPLALDNDVFTDWRKHRQGISLAIKDYKTRFKEFPKLTSITVFEARWGFESQVIKYGSLDPKTEQLRSEMEELIQTCGVLDFDQHAASIAAHVFARLSQSQRNRHWRDILIASTALAHGYGVATRNKDDFELIGNDLPDISPTLDLTIWKP
ncbi:MAG: type II toxin-antitoxin system VapC family toxin [Acidobacteria bacterium]|nr:type II toxin-antitoxin system VapC family toxin [Acidobacteriota bacterium]